MASIAKYTKNQIGGLTRHYERAKNESGEYLQFSNQEIDTSRTHENYNLAPAHDNQLNFINEKCKELHCLNRKDVNVMCSWVVTLPKEFPREQERDFFEKTYDFLINRYGGEQNVISAYVHKDETTPHMHFSFVPVVYDKKKEKYKISAKELITRYDLKTFHDDLSKHITHHFGHHFGITNGATEKGNLTVAELKLKTKKEKIKSQIFKHDEKSKELENKILELEHKSKIIDEKYNALICVENSFRSVQNELDKLTTIKASKALLGGKITILEGDYNNLLQKAKLGIVYADKINQFDKLLEENKSLKSQIEKNKSLKFDDVKEKANQINLIKTLESQNSKMRDFIISYGLTEKYNAITKQNIKSNKIDFGR